MDHLVEWSKPDSRLTEAKNVKGLVIERIPPTIDWDYPRYLIRIGGVSAECQSWGAAKRLVEQIIKSWRQSDND